MIRRSLSQLVRAGQTAAESNGRLRFKKSCCFSNSALHQTTQHRSCWSSSLEHYQRSTNDGRCIILSSRPFHTTSTVAAQDNEYYPPRRDGAFHRKNNNNRNDNHQGGRGSRQQQPNKQRQNRGGNRQGNNPNFNNNLHHRGGDSQLTDSYITHLEQRAKDHIQNFPTSALSSNDSSSNDVATLLSPWSRTTIELIMLISKQWGRNSNHKFDREQIHKAVVLADDLLHKLLMVRKNEVDGIAESSNELLDRDNRGRDDATSKMNNKGMRRESKNLNTEILCQTVALGWSRCDPKTAPEAANKAQSILNLLEYICSQREKIEYIKNSNMQKSKVASFDLNDVTPSIRIYNHVLSCWSRSLDADAEIKAKTLLDRMVNSQGKYARPDTFSFNNMLNLYASRGDVNAAEELLEQMEQPDHEAPADVYSYSITMNAFQKRFTGSNPGERDMKDPQRAEELLSRLVTRYEKSGFRDGNLRPNSVIFSTIIAMYAQADRVLKEDSSYYGNKTRGWKADKVAMNEGKKDVGWGAANAERVLDWMIALSERERRGKSGKAGVGGEKNNIDARMSGRADLNQNEVIQPSTFNFVTAMDAWAKAGKGVEGARNCERLLDRLVSMYDKLGYPELSPNALCFGTVIDAWAKANEEYDTAEHAESLLDRMEDLFLHRKSSNRMEMLSCIAYNLVIDAWSRRSGKDVADRAEKILRRLENNYQLTNNRFLRPDVISYTAAMKACVNHPNGGEKALKILKEMNNQYRDGNKRAKPDAQALAVAIDACAKSGLASEAERILNDVDDSKKNNILFNTIMTGYKKEGRGKQAEALLRRMIRLENAGQKHCSPDMISYSLCIEAWGNSTSPNRVARARALLDESIKRYKSGDNDCKPSHVTFNVMADSIGSSDDSDREEQVLALFQSMEEIGCEPNLVSFNILIKTCANATGSKERKRNALQIAASAFNSLSSAGLKPDSVTYTSMIHAMVNLMEDSTEKTKTISSLFEQCCSNGCLNQHILNVLDEKMSDYFSSITGVSSSEGTPKIKILPAEWSHRSSRDKAANNNA